MAWRLEVWSMLASLAWGHWVSPTLRLKGGEGWWRLLMFSNHPEKPCIGGFYQPGAHWQRSDFTACGSILYRNLSAVPKWQSYFAGRVDDTSALIDYLSVPPQSTTSHHGHGGQPIVLWLFLAGHRYAAVRVFFWDQIVLTVSQNWSVNKSDGMLSFVVVVFEVFCARLVSLILKIPLHARCANEARKSTAEIFELHWTFSCCGLGGRSHNGHHTRCSWTHPRGLHVIAPDSA